MQYLPIQTFVYIHLLYRNYHIFYCLYAVLLQVQLILQVHYINNTTSHKNNLHAIHTILIGIEHMYKWIEISDRELT